MRKSVLILAFKPLTHTRRVGLLAAYFAQKNCDVTVHCLSADPRYLDHDRIQFITHEGVGIMERLWAKYHAFKTPNYFRTQARGIKAGLFFLANCLLLALITPLWALQYGVRYLSPHLHDTWAVKFETERADIFRRSRLKQFERQVWASWVESETDYDLIVCHDVYPINLCLKIMERLAERLRPRLWFDQVDHPTHRSFRPANMRLKSRDKHRFDRMRWLISKSNLRLLSSPQMHIEGLPETALETTIPHCVLLNANPSAIIEHAIKTIDSIHLSDKGSAPVTFIMTGTHFETTGVHRAIDFIHAYGPQAHLQIIGAFPRQTYQNFLKAYIVDLGLGGRVTFQDRLPPDVLMRALSKAHAVLMPFDPAHRNLKSILPNRVFDALTVQRPILAQSGTFSAHWVTQKNFGVSLDFYNPKQASESAHAFLSHPRSTLALEAIPAWEDQTAQLDPFLAVI